MLPVSFFKNPESLLSLSSNQTLKEFCGIACVLWLQYPPPPKIVDMVSAARVVCAFLVVVVVHFFLYRPMV